MGDVLVLEFNLAAGRSTGQQSAGQQERSDCAISVQLHIVRAAAHEAALQAKRAAEEIALRGTPSARAAAKRMAEQLLRRLDCSDDTVTMLKVLPFDALLVMGVQPYQLQRQRCIRKCLVASYISWRACSNTPLQTKPAVAAAFECNIVPCRLCRMESL